MSYQQKNRTTIGALGYLVGRGARFIFEHRARFGVALVVLAVYAATVSLPLFIVIPAWALFLAGVAFDVYKGRRFLGHLTRRWVGSRVSRDVVCAALSSGVLLSVEEVENTLPGELVRVHLARGQTVAKLERVTDVMTACLEVPDVRVIRNREDPSRPQLSVIRRDTFATMGATPWPLMNADRVDVDSGIPFGQDEFGRVVDVRLLSRNILLGGAPDAGKSTALRVLIAACALDPKYKLWMLDAKTGGAEFVHWAPAAHRLVRGRNLLEAVELFAALEERVTQREQAIVRAGEIFVLPTMERDVLFIDELPQFLRTREGDSKDEIAAVKSIRGSIWTLISTGRWAGMITVLSAQKPTADIVPSESRDLVDHRFGLHCNTRAMSDAVMGDGNGESPVDATDIPSGQPGVGFYLGDNGVQKVRSFFIDHREAKEIASRVAGRQLDADLQAMS